MKLRHGRRRGRANIKEHTLCGDHAIAVSRGTVLSSMKGNNNADSSSDSDIGAGGDNSSGKGACARQKGRKKKKKGRIQEKRSHSPTKSKKSHMPSWLPGASDCYSEGSSDQGRSKPTHDHNSMAEEPICLMPDDNPPHERSENTVSESFESNVYEASMKEGRDSLMVFNHMESKNVTSDTDYVYGNPQTEGKSCENPEISPHNPAGDALVSGVTTSFTQIYTPLPLETTQSNPPDPVYEFTESCVQPFSNSFGGIHPPVCSVSIHKVLWATK